MASEWARDGIRFNAVAPGYVMTDLGKSLVAKELVNFASFEDKAPLGRCCEPAEIAEAIALPASSRAGFITGVTRPMDSGWLTCGVHPFSLGSVAQRRVVA